MGANIVTKFLGESAEKFKEKIILGISVCQGYDAARCEHTFYLLQTPVQYVVQ